MTRLRLAQAGLASLAVLCAVPAPAGDSLPGGDRGRAIFHGDPEIAAAIPAMIGARRTTAARLVCASCHGRDGLGRIEGDAAAPPIVRGEAGLDRPAVTADGGIRAGYDRDAFAAALSDGNAADGRVLSERMPRYRLDDADIDLLWTWLRDLPVLQRQGIEPDRLVFSVAGVPGREVQVGRFRAQLAEAVAKLPRRFGKAIVIRSEIHEPGTRSCPGDGAVALIVAGLDAQRRLLEDARRCAVPAVLAVDDPVGNENTLDLRGVSAPLQAQWRTLSKAAGASARLVLPSDMAPWEEQVLGFAGIRPPQDDASAAPAEVLFLPYGLDRSLPPDHPALVFAPLSASRDHYRAWLDKGHRLRLAVADPAALAPPGDGPAKPPHQLVADLLDRATLRAGPEPTRAGFVEAIDGVSIGPLSGPLLSYPGYRLSGTRKVAILAIGE